MNDKTLFFQEQLLKWYHHHGRHDLPWQHQSPYHVWLSEIMLQQTQVSTVIPYYHRFIEAFPRIEALAEASEEQVFKLWAGLGYYSRAKHLHQTAKIVAKEYHGIFPHSPETLQKLPGIGPSTCAAILSQAFDLPFAICDGNVKRVLGRFWGIDDVKTYQSYANRCMPSTNCQSYTQAIMDMGATCCKTKKPHCNACPLSAECHAYQNHKIDDYPIKTIRLKRKTVRYDFLGQYNDHRQWFWIKRPAKGIWPKLWCFPHTTSNQPGDIIHYHDLTHQKMEIHLHLSKNNEVNEMGQWLTLEECQAIAIPQAFRVLLTAISQNVKF